MDLDVAGSGSPTSPMGTNIQSGSNLDMDVNPLFDNEKEKLEKSSLLAQQASTWYDMATGDYHSYKASLPFPLAYPLPERRDDRIAA